ncbi:MAG: sulfite exporter TauE/SafE family protein [Actinomycetaceae bacterium]|nr:sulfite exporter TauE/SafE family protein [Actinomycetaceae bacterium]
MYAVLFIAGVGAGIVGYLVGLASLVSYPALVAVGIPPVLANTSNTVGLIGSGIGSLAGSWKQLRAIKTYSLAIQVVVAIVGGLAGGLLLVVADPGVFEAVVPWLVLSGALLVAFSPHINRLRDRAERRRYLKFWAYLIPFTLVAIYVGYFGAGGAVMYMALAVLGTTMTIHEAVVMKTPLMFAANTAAAILFIARGDVDWPAALVIGAGNFVGGYAGPFIQRFFSETLMRRLVVLGGIVMTVWLLVR